MKSPMRILLIGPYSPPRGGVQAHVSALRQYLLARGVSCEVIDLSPGRKTEGSGIYGPRNALGLAWLLLTLRYDVAHLHVGGNDIPPALSHFAAATSPGATPRSRCYARACRIADQFLHFIRAVSRLPQKVAPRRQRVCVGSQ